MCMGGGQAATPTGSTVLPKTETPAPVIPVAPPTTTAKPTAASTPAPAAPTTSSTTGLNIPTA